ncbi:MAG: Dihydrofolate reductase type 3 [Bacteroidetes bacterium ADurb.Bin408]|nr:MAG: Dihydrofolate reductase type 3 [Bacteroidetes bacterium ADurb.Bin408]
MKLSLIVAIAENNVIGKDNKLIWHLPADLKYFKALTMGCPIIMGRKTFDSIGKPLHGRTSVIITRNPNYRQDGCLIAHSLQEATAMLKHEAKAFIIGGEQIYRQAINMVDFLYVTKVHHAFDGDAFFPEIKPDLWEKTFQSDHQPDDKNAYPYSFMVYKRKTISIP